MNVEAVSTYLNVLDNGSYVAAARQLGIGVSTAVQRVRSLQDDLDVALLQRDGRAVVPTEAGRAVAPALRTWLQDMRRIKSTVHVAGCGGEYALGMIATSVTDHAARIVSHLADKFPGCVLSLRPGTSLELYNAVEAGLLDAAVIVRPSGGVPKSIKVDGIADQPLAYVRPGESCAGRSSLPYILYDRDSWGGAIAWNYLKDVSPSPRIVCEVDDPQAITRMVATGLGQALLPVWADLRKTEGVALDILRDGPRRPVVLVSNRARPSLDKVVLEQVRIG